MEETFLQMGSWNNLLSHDCFIERLRLISMSQGKAQCRRGLQPFAEGETKDDITDPCNQCRCEKGHLTW